MKTARGTVDMQGRRESVYMYEEILGGRKRQRMKLVWSCLQSCRIPTVSLLYSPNLHRADQVCSGTGDVKEEETTFWKFGQNTSVDRTEPFLPDPTPVSLRA